ncbi:MAG: translocation/assembly module TamB domain-containing protein [Verrucomicrobiales bacterium]|nr:translocation/assembly module TamB domain-containing protein [Verrucomicrobiales bacterium]MCP5560389.1 translocation/assembly module TamB domain-containing protein [Verrucomicrobiaceae bacterium]
MPEAPPPPAKKRSFLSRWFRRILLAGLLLLAVALIFHQALLRFTLNHLAPPIAKRFGYELRWQVGGSVTSDLELKSLTLSGPPTGPLKSLTLHDASMGYDLWQLWQHGPDRFLQQLHLTDADIELDLRPPSPTPAPTAKAIPKKPQIPDIRVDDIRLHNINVLLHLPQGDVNLRGLTLELIEGSKGQFTLKELSLPDGMHLVDVHGTTELHGRALTLTQVNLLPNLIVHRLHADLAALPDGPLPIELNVSSGPAKVQLSGSVSGLSDELTVDVNIQIDALDRARLSQFIKLPESPDWSAESLTITAQGPPLRPDLLKAQVALDGRLELPTVPIAGNVQTEFQMSDAQLHVSKLGFTSGATTLEASADATLPAQWKDMARIDGQVQWKLDCTALETLPLKNLQLSGRMNGTGSVTLTKGKLTDLTSQLHLTSINIDGRKIDKLDVDTAGSLDQIQIKAIDIQIDPRNRLAISGDFSPNRDRPFDLNWQAQSDDLAAVMQFAGIKDQPLPEAGNLKLNGHAAGTLAALKAKDFSSVQADVQLTLTEAKWQGASLQELKLDASSDAGIASVKNLSLTLDDQNHIALQGKAPLKLDGPFQGQAEARLPELGKLGAWLALAKAPPIAAGSLNMNWKGSGDLSQRTIDGKGDVDLQGFQMAGIPDPVSATLLITHDGKQLEVEKLTASTGRFRIEGSATASETDINLRGLQLWSDDTKLAALIANVPLSPGTQPPIDATRPLDIDLQMESLSFDQISAAIGKPLPIKGTATAKVNLHGPLQSLAGDIAVDLADVSSAATGDKLKPAQVKFTAHLADGKIHTDLSAHQPPFEPLTASTDLPLDLPALLNDPTAFTNAPLHAEIDLPDSDLDIVRSFVPAIAEIDGKIGMKVNVGGTLAKPDYQGLLTLKASRVLATAPGAPELRDVNARFALAGQNITIEELSAMVAGGQVGATGTVDLTHLKDPAFDIHITAADALIVRDEALSQRANADLHITGSLKKGDVSGRVDLVRGRVFKEVEFLPLSLPEQLPPPPRAAKISQEGAKAPPPFDQWTFDIAVATKDQIRLLGNVLNGGVEVDLRVHGTGAVPELEGKASLKDARLRLPFSRMIFSHGEILFTKDKPFEPQVDIEGNSVVNNYRVALYATGSALDPVIRFTSSPPLSEGDIATLLATGATADDLQSGEGVAANRAAFLLVTKMYRKLFNKNGKSQYDEEPPKLSFNFSLLNASSTRRSLTAIYEINPKVQAVGTVSEDGGFRGLLYYLIRFR